jgi:S-adenosyl methyltransferase
VAERSPRPSGSDEPPREPAEIDISVAHAARVYDYLLGGSDNFAVDREAAELQAREIGGLDNARTAVRAQRAFLGRALRHLAGEAGIRQFLDIGTGIPTEGNVHQVVQAVAPGSRIVCVDNDTLVLAHAHAYMKATSAKATAYVDGDLRDVKLILTKASATLDLSKPFAVVLVAVLHLFADDEDPWAIVGQLVEAMPSGSYLVMSHLTNDFYPKEITRMADVIPDSARFRFNLRTYDQVSRFFDGVELVEPGLVPVDQWRPDGTGPPSDGRIIAAIYGGVARKP